MNRKLIFSAAGICILVIALLSACTKDEGKKPVKPVVGQCDTITYEKHIKPMVTLHCMNNNPQCHPSNAPLGSYNEVKAKGEAGRLKARVLDGAGGFMPPTGNPLSIPLTQQEKDQLQCWLGNGFKQ